MSASKAVPATPRCRLTAKQQHGWVGALWLTRHRLHGRGCVSSATRGPACSAPRLWGPEFGPAHFNMKPTEDLAWVQVSGGNRQMSWTLEGDPGEGAQPYTVGSGERKQELGRQDTGRRAPSNETDFLAARDAERETASFGCCAVGGGYLVFVSSSWHSPETSDFLRDTGDRASAALRRLLVGPWRVSGWGWSLEKPGLDLEAWNFQTHLEISVDEGLQVDPVTRGQRFNQPCLCDGTT